MMLELLTLGLSMTSILGNTTVSNTPIVDVSYSTAANTALSQQNRTIADPCSNYTILNESWRNVHSPLTTYHCDDNLAPGTWYRFMSPAGIAIPETIPPADSCGTWAQMWLNGAHPRNVSSDPVDRVLCASWNTNPCWRSTTVKVALCPGGYYVYMAPTVTAPRCNVAWCAVDANETLSPRYICEQQGDFYCSLSEFCVAHIHRCNGNIYCSYGEDEADCNSSSSVTPSTALSSSCGGTLYGSGYVRSPKYPLNYDNFLRCNWTLIASPYYGNIVLQFLSFKTELCCDFVSIYNSSGALINRYSGTSYPGTIVLGSNAVISFTTDGSLVDSGFSISFSTSDPCSNHTILNESWRNVHSPLTSDHCDDYLAPGTWYRFMSPAGIEIPETIPPTNSCGTAAPMWLNGAHPRNVSSEPVDRVLCANWNGNPCWRSTTVKVALCPGGYYVYMAPTLTAPGCNLAWCAVDANETVSPRYNCEHQGSFYCSLSQRCVDSYHRCNGYSYCLYGEDEAGCNSSSTVTASTIASAATPSPRDSCESQGNFYCSFSGLCFAMSIRCNGYYNCYYGEDESGCSPTTPTTPTTTPVQRESCVRQGNFYCDFSRECIAMWRRCDGYAHCYYGEDESGCSNTTSTSRPESTASFRDTCERLGYFYCASSVLCVAMSNRCDGYSNCNYGEDESGCVSSSPGTTIASASTPSPRDSCERQGNFYCAYSGLCVAMSQRCNGYSNCYYGDDESGCVTSSPGTSIALASTPSPRDSCERQGNFYCAYSGLCVAMSQRCNGYSNCYYGEDESGCSPSTPTTTNTGRTAASVRPEGGFIAASGFVQVFLQLSKSSASKLPQECWIVVSGYVVAWLLGHPRLVLH